MDNIPLLVQYILVHGKYGVCNYIYIYIYTCSISLIEFLEYTHGHWSYD